MKINYLFYYKIESMRSQRQLEYLGVHFVVCYTIPATANIKNFAHIHLNEITRGQCHLFGISFVTHRLSMYSKFE